MNTLSAGYGCTNVTPPLGIEMRGYYQERHAKGVLDELYLRALALRCGAQTVILLSMDICAIPNPLSLQYRSYVAEKTGLPLEAIFLSATHIHTGPSLQIDAKTEDGILYRQLLFHKAADAAELALADLKPAKMGCGVGKAPNIAFSRRYRMKDGSVQTNPGVNNPDILHPIGEIDDRVNVLRFHRESADDLVLVNFGCHPDTVGGELLSADWPGFLCRTVEQSIEGTKCIFFNGVQGDVNHVNTAPRGGDLNDMQEGFDGVSRSYGHARHMGRVVAGAVLQVYDKVCYQDVGSIHLVQKNIRIPANLPEADEVPKAQYIVDMEMAGKSNELPYCGMLLTTALANAHRILRLADGPAAFDMMFGAVSIGNVVLIAIPGEPFSGVGIQLKQAPGWDLVLPLCLTNGCEGYFPMQEAYDEGGYETAASSFKAGVAELIIREVTALLNDLRKERTA